jgi:malonyl-CoA O-methyltransferase
MRGVFVTGTGTGVGKTVVSAALMHRYRAVTALRYWKPVQTGYLADDDSATVQRLGGCAPDEIYAEGVRLPEPLSPHLAARLAHVSLTLEETLRPARELGVEGGAWVIEGAGGVLVPLNGQHLVIDLIVELGLPAVVTAHSGLGTINHTLLTLESLRARPIGVAGVVLVGEPNADNREAIETYGAVRVIGEMPLFDPLTTEALGPWACASLDCEGVLEDFFRETTP